MFCGSSVALYFFRVIKDQIVKGEFADIKIFYAYFMLAGKANKEHILVCSTTELFFGGFW
jgi:hypothetical protein